MLHKQIKNMQCQLFWSSWCYWHLLFRQAMQMHSQVSARFCWKSSSDQSFDSITATNERSNKWYQKIYTYGKSKQSSGAKFKRSFTKQSSSAKFKGGFTKQSSNANFKCSFAKQSTLQLVFSPAHGWGVFAILYQWWPSGDTHAFITHKDGCDTWWLDFIFW